MPKQAKNKTSERVTTTINSWKPEVQADGTGTWYGNALRFATEEEALAHAKELDRKWTLVRGRVRATPSDDPVNYRYDIEEDMLYMLDGTPASSRPGKGPQRRNG